MSESTEHDNNSKEGGGELSQANSELDLNSEKTSESSKLQKDKSK